MYVCKTILIIPKKKNLLNVQLPAACQVLCVWGSPFTVFCHFWLPLENENQTFIATAPLDGNFIRYQLFVKRLETKISNAREPEGDSLSTTFFAKRSKNKTTIRLMREKLASK